AAVEVAEGRVLLQVVADLPAVLAAVDDEPVVAVAAVGDDDARANDRVAVREPPERVGMQGHRRGGFLGAPERGGVEGFALAAGADPEESAVAPDGALQAAALDEA